jgi:hypothetical protein
MCTTHRMSGLSMPMPNAEVATMTGTSPARNSWWRRVRTDPARPPW